jgi:hypothetical protein
MMHSEGGGVEVDGGDVIVPGFEEANGGYVLQG